MIVSFVVRLVIDELPVDGLVGEVHDVATGDQAIVRSVEDLVTVFAEGAERARSRLRLEAGDSAQ